MARGREPARPSGQRPAGRVRRPAELGLVAVLVVSVLTGPVSADGAAANPTGDAGPDRAAQALRVASARTGAQAAAVTTRLTAQARAYVRVERADASVLAAAALDCADDALEAAEPGVDPERLAELDQAAAALADLARGSWPGRDRGQRGVMLPEPTDVEVVAGIRATASEIFGLSMHIGAATLNAVDDGAAARLASLTVASESAAAADRAVAAFSGTELTPLPLSVWPNGEFPTQMLCNLTFATDALLRCDAAVALERLNERYRADVGTDLVIVSSYRSLADQVAVAQARGALAARPGTSNHGLGIAVDVGGVGGVGVFDAPGYLWLKVHAQAFGWHHPRIMEPGGTGPLEPWHWEFGPPEPVHVPAPVQVPPQG